jgi:mono/diheme cytochrome c family protein
MIHARIGQGDFMLKVLAALAVVVAFAGTAFAETPYERGRYLVSSILNCGNCHTPKGPNADKILSGGNRFDTPGFNVVASNITPDRDTGIGRWSDADIKKALVEGVRPNGVKLAGVMPSSFYGIMSNDDLNAVVAYLKAVPPVGNKVDAPVYKAEQKHHAFPGGEKSYTRKDMRTKAQRGFYLATIGHCMECHTPREKGESLFATKLGAGGREFKGPWGTSKAANITSSKAAGLGGWSDAEVRRAITQGISRDGRKLNGPMGFAAYAKMSKADVDAIVAWLRTVPPKD